jgi:hypothetical protein
LPSTIDALADCLEAMRGGVEMEACLAMYPQYRGELRPLLQIATLLRPLPPEITPSPVFRDRTRVRILERNDGQDGTSLAPDRPAGKF